MLQVINASVNLDILLLSRVAFCQPRSPPPPQTFLVLPGVILLALCPAGRGRLGQQLEHKISSKSLNLMWTRTVLLLYVPKTLPR